MSDIDWSKAPEGATHYGYDSDYYVSGWYKVDGDTQKFKNSDTMPDRWGNILVNRPTDQLIPRPQLKPVYTKEMSDNGELPSVGMECMVICGNDLNSTWHECVVDFIGKFKAVVTTQQISEKLIDLEFDKFKPLTSPIELINNEPYEFDYHNGIIGMKGVVMRYSKVSDSFFFDNTVFKREYCTNITLLTPEGES